MAASLGWEGPPPGSPPMLSASKTVFLKSIGTFCRTRRPRPNLSAAFPCLATHSPTERRLGTEPIRSLLLYLIDLIIPGLRPNRAGQKPKEALNACTSNLSLRWRPAQNLGTHRYPGAGCAGNGRGPNRYRIGTLKYA